MSEIEQLTKAYYSGKLSHAYLFEGDDAEAMTSTAMAFAQLILCREDTKCHMKVSQYNHPDFHHIQTEETTIKKENIEQLIHHMNRLPIESNHKVYIIQDFEKLTIQSENSILKFLEEPPPNTIAILLSTKPEQILDTIHSRCQHVYFKPIQRTKFVDLLVQEGVSRPTGELISTFTTQFDVAIALSTEYDLMSLRQVILQWCQRLLNQQEMALIGVIELLRQAKNRRLQLLTLAGVNAYFQDLLYVKVGMSEKVTFSELQESYSTYVMHIDYDDLTHMIETITEAHKKLNQNVNPTLVFEQIVIKMKG
ncbi:DNA polymerase III subunit delta' [Staphylococcus sp. 17KM0847]|uniref:DNA polymerase III subunit delta' n=1 Tax=Staphylococcus sp. 17KM0847 TaxID=2583989 RepID=UPI0015DC0347|nr:DNA polymerase III subunit delta' [Staphylococcus sp. 17KM0847]QLK85280.1 DNA polymerase III subunit delta' [Staphylococcus sp. 17KM0847]